MTHQDTIEIKTTRHGEMHNISQAVQGIIAKSGIQVGICHVFNVGSTATVGTIEYESGLERDLPEALDRLIPPSRSYGHEQAWHDGNGHSHLQASMMGPSVTLPVRDGQAVLGTWQQVFHLECDIKPRTRRIVVTVVGE